MFKGIVLLVIGGFVLVSAFRGLISILIGRGEPPKNVCGYATAAIHGRDPMAPPGKSLYASILHLLKVIFWLPNKIWAKWVHKWLVKPCTVLFWLLLAASIYAYNTAF